MEIVLYIAAAVLLTGALLFAVYRNSSVFF